MKRDLPSESAYASTAAAEWFQPWHYSLSLLAAVLVWIVAWYASTAMAMVDTWARSVTFNHGFVVLPITFWLVWRDRAQLAQLVPRPSWWGLLPLAAAGGLWLLGAIAGVNALMQFALTAFLVLTVVTMLGARVVRKLAFPLGFLFFAVPVGEFIMPQLMEWTADFTVGALRLSGIPVYREGQQFVIPSGHWSVIEACSGLRYLIASLMVGTLFAHLSYRSLSRKLIFIGFAALVPIVANWLRAYMIVMLGHLSSGKLAAGVDHFIYGWVFFGLVIAIMLSVGARWREDEESAVSPIGTNSIAVTPTSKLWLFAIGIAVALVTAGWKTGYWAIERSNASAPARLSALASTGGWAPIAAEPAWRPSFADSSDELHRIYRNGGQSIGLFMAYYRNQDSQRKLVSSEHVLVTSEDRSWARVSGGTRQIDFDGEPLSIRTTKLRGTNGKRMTVWQWYWINRHLTSSDHWAKAYTALSRLRGQGDDSAVIIVYADDEQAGGAGPALESFIRAAAPAIRSALHHTRDAR